MSECGHVYKTGCYSCLETKIDKIENKIDKLLMYKTSEAGYKDGYEKGVRDMWEVAKDKFSCMCDSWYVKNKCVFETCPIAQKLLKGVK